MISDYGEGGSTIIIGLGGSLINTPPIPIFDYEILEYVPIDKPLYTPDIDYDPQGWSDRRLKKNIELVGKSPSGINIYEWEYKDVNFMNSLSDKVYGEGKYRGVMADDIPLDAVTELDNGYLAVNYSKIDVDFEKIKRYKNDHIRK